MIVLCGSVTGQELKANSLAQQHDLRENQNDSLSVHSKNAIHVNGGSNSIQITNTDTKPESCENSQTANKNTVEVNGENNEINIVQSGGNSTTTVRQNGNYNKIKITQTR